MNSARKRFLVASVGILAGFAMGGAAVWFSKDIQALTADAEQWGPYAYALGFGVNFLSSGSLFIPIPGWAFVFSMGSFLNPTLLGFVSGLGSALGEGTGYLAGLAGQSFIQSSRMYDRVHAWTFRYGMIALFFMAAAPNPLFDLGGLAAGAIGIPYWKFFLATWLGKSIRFIALAASRQWV